MKIVSLTLGLGLSVALALGGCTETRVTRRADPRPAYASNRRLVTGSNIPRRVGRPVGSSLATASPYTHADDVDRELGITAPAARGAGQHN